MLHAYFDESGEWCRMLTESGVSQLHMKELWSNDRYIT
jgi:hypothetical protein